MISLPFLLTGFALGFTGSLHCVGMCGPLALSLPLQGIPGVKRAAAIGFYHSGRLTGYGILGLATGLVGKQFLLAGYQQVFSIAMGCLLLGYLVLSLSNRHRATVFPIYRALQTVMVRYMTKPVLKNMLISGFGNGLLPCGMVYIAMAAATAQGEIGSSVAFMLCFGLGTVPLLAMVSIAGLYFSPSARQTFKRLSPVFAGCIAVLLILRGLNLDIPFISPALSRGNTGAVISCH